MAYTTIDDPSAYFQTKIYTGNGGSLAVTNDGNADLQPDWAWFKKRGGSEGHALFDTSRGIARFLASNSTAVEQHQPTTGNTDADDIASFDSDGFTFQGGGGAINQSSNTYVAWQWKANGGTTTSVSGTGTTAGSTKAGTYQANTTAGFSIVTFSTGSDDSGDHRIQHGLGAVPHFILTKERDGTYDWYTYHHKGTDDNDYLRLNLTNAKSDAGSRNVFDGSDFTSTYFEMDNNNIINDNKTYVAYCFTEIQGYSKFGSYTGNGNADGPFVYTGFKPAWVMYKRTDATGEWPMLDNTRNPFNVANSHLKADLSDAEVTNTSFNLDLLSNGFKIRATNTYTNADGGTYIYMAFAEHPFVSSEGVPTTAR